MEAQLLTCGVAATAAPPSASASRDAVSDSLNRQQQLLRLAMLRQLQQEERQQQHLSPQSADHDKPAEAHTTTVRQQQPQRGCEENSGRHFNRQRPVGHPGKQQVLRCFPSSSKAETMQQYNSGVALGSGSVSTANSGSENSSRSASDDAGGRPSRARELNKKSPACEVVALEDGPLGLPSIRLAPPEQEPQRWHRQRPHNSQDRVSDGDRQQVHEQHQQQAQELTEEQCRLLETLRRSSQQGELLQQQQQLSAYTDAGFVEENLLPSSGEPGPQADVRATAFPTARRQLYAAGRLPPLPPAIPHTAHALPAEHGAYNVIYGRGLPEGPVRHARKKLPPPAPVPSPSVSSSAPSTASSASKPGARSSACRMYRTSRITEVKSFAGTLEEYLLFRQQQAEMQEAASAASQRGGSGSPLAQVTNRQLGGRAKETTSSNGGRDVGTTGREGSAGKAATRSSRNSSRGVSASWWLRPFGVVSGEEADSTARKDRSTQSNENFPPWERNGAVQQQQRKKVQGIFRQLSRLTSEPFQQVGNSMSSADSTGAGRAPAPENNTSFRQTGSYPSAGAENGDETEETAGEERAGAQISESRAARRRGKYLLGAESEGSEREQSSDLARKGSRARTNESPTPDQEQVREDGGEGSGTKEEKAATGRDADDGKQQSANGKGSRPRGRKFIPLEMRNGEIVWPTDRPVIPLNAWIFQNFSADEPLNPQNWVHLPNVGPAASPAINTLQSALEQSKYLPPHPSITCSTAPLIRSPLLDEARLTEPVKLPPIKLAVGCEVPRFIIQANIPPDTYTRTDTSDASAPSTQAKKPRSRSLTGRLSGGSAATLKSAYTPFVKQIHVRHRPTNFEGLVLRAEDAGRILLVRSEDGHLRKVHRDECEAVGFMCASVPPPERSLTDAAHVHATHLLSASAGPLRGRGACSPCRTATAVANADTSHRRSATWASYRPYARRPPLPPRRDHLQQTAQEELQRAAKRHTLESIPSAQSAPPWRRGESNRTCVDLSSGWQSSAAHSPRITANEKVFSDADQKLTRELPPQQVPDLQEVLVIAQQHADATMRNTIALKNMASIPRIRAVDSQVTVEAVRVKKYTLEGTDEENLLPVFGGEPPKKSSVSSSAGLDAMHASAVHDDHEAPPDAARLLLQKHGARQMLKKREEQLRTGDIIYAQDAPEAARASGIAPPTIVKETFVVPPREDEQLPYVLQAPGIVTSLNQYCNETRRSKLGASIANAWPGVPDVSPLSTENPNMQHLDGVDYRQTREKQQTMATNTDVLLNAEGPAWFFDLKTQFQSRLLHQYHQTGSMEAAAMAVSSGGYTPLIFTASNPAAVQRKQAKVLRDELREMEFAPIERTGTV